MQGHMAALAHPVPYLHGKPLEALVGGHEGEVEGTVEVKGDVVGHGRVATVGDAGCRGG